MGIWSQVYFFFIFFKLRLQKRDQDEKVQLEVSPQSTEMLVGRHVGRRRGNREPCYWILFTQLFV